MEYRQSSGGVVCNFSWYPGLDKIANNPFGSIVHTRCLVLFFFFSPSLLKCPSVSLFHFPTCPSAPVGRGGHQWARTCAYVEGNFAQHAQQSDTARTGQAGEQIIIISLSCGSFLGPVKVSSSRPLAWRRKMETHAKAITELREKFFKKLDDEGPPDSSTYTWAPFPLFSVIKSDFWHTCINIVHM